MNVLFFMNIFVFLLVGLIAGWVAGKVVEGRGLGTLTDIIVGVIGALIGGFFFDIIGVTAYGFFGSVLMSALGAIVFLLIIGMFKITRKTHGPLTK